MIKPGPRKARSPHGGAPRDAQWRAIRAASGCATLSLGELISELVMATVGGAGKGTVVQSHYFFLAISRSARCLSIFDARKK